MIMMIITIKQHTLQLKLIPTVYLGENNNNKLGCRIICKAQKYFLHFWKHTDKKSFSNSLEYL